jgi:hypothetical protein
MGRGRKSPEALANPLVPGTWPDPPPELEPTEAVIWNRVVRALPQDWINPANSPLMKQYVRHVANTDLLAGDISICRQEIAEARRREADATGDAKAVTRARTDRAALERGLHRLMRMVGAETDRATRLGTKLKLTLQSRYSRSDGAAAATRRPISQPWNDWGNPPRQ